MKKSILSLLLLVSGAASLRADEVALLKFRVGKEDALRPVAIEFYEADAPGHVASFKKLARSGFYKGTSIHRLFAHTMVQMGDPLSSGKDRSSIGTGGPQFTLTAEISRKHEEGAVAAARLPDKLNPSRRSNGSQFLVCLKPMPAYDGQQTVFGRVLYGLEALDSLSAKPVDSNDDPVERITLVSVKILDRQKLPPAPQPPAPGAPAKSAKPWWRFF